MKAGVIERLGAPPRVTSYPDPTPSTDTEVLIKVEATALERGRSPHRLGGLSRRKTTTSLRSRDRDGRRHCQRP